jgi:hypothetical protein
MHDPPSVAPEREAVDEGRQKGKEGAHFDLGQAIQLEARSPVLEQVLRSPRAKGSHQKTAQPNAQLQRSNWRLV